MNPVEKDVITEMDVYESMGKPRKSSDDSDDKEFTWNYVEDPATDSDEPDKFMRKSVTLTKEESSPISSVVKTVNAEESPTKESPKVKETVELKKAPTEEVKTAEVTPTEVKTAEVTPTEVKTAEVTSTEVKTAEVKTAEATPTKEVKTVDSTTQHDVESDTDSDMPPLVDDTSDESSDDMPELVESTDENSSDNSSDENSSDNSSDENSSDEDQEMMMMIFRDSDCRRCKTAIHTLLNHPHDSDSDDETFQIKREFPNIIIYTFLLFTALHLVNLITTYCNVRPSY